MKLVDDLHAYLWSGRDNNCNTYLFARAFDGDRHVVVDPGHLITPALREPGLERLQAEMREDGVDPDAIGMVILTHCHPDHCEAAATIRKQNKALVALHEIETGFYSTHLGGRTDLFIDEGTLILGPEDRLQLEVYHSPGHSPGHITIYWPARKVLIAGDLIFYRSTGRVDLSGGSAQQLRDSINRLSELEIEHVLCGHPYGHPGIIQGKEEVRNNFDFIRKHVLS
jgi:glyoxylase-like metal-dependent hydrolase (beta-lactamase superfamily II)